MQVVTAQANDAAAKLKLGLSIGGREKEGASFRRPAQTGTTSPDLAEILGTDVSGPIDVVINDNSTGAPVPILSSTNFQLPATPVSPALRDQLQTLIRGINNAAAQQTTVQLSGSFLRVLPSAATPNGSITFSGAGATAALLTTGAGSFANVQQYSLGTGATFGAQWGPLRALMGRRLMALRSSVAVRQKPASMRCLTLCFSTSWPFTHNTAQRGRGQKRDYRGCCFVRGTSSLLFGRP